MTFNVWYLCAVKEKARPGCGPSRGRSKTHLIFQGKDFSKSAQWDILRFLCHDPKLNIFRRERGLTGSNDCFVVVVVVV
jgi:hypothetical protein